VTKFASVHVFGIFIFIYCFHEKCEITQFLPYSLLFFLVATPTFWKWNRTRIASSRESSFRRIFNLTGVTTAPTKSSPREEEEEEDRSEDPGQRAAPTPTPNAAVGMHRDPATVPAPIQWKSAKTHHQSSQKHEKTSVSF
jgi:hypothetical protein